MFTKQKQKQKKTPSNNKTPGRSEGNNFNQTMGVQLTF